MTDGRDKPSHRIHWDGTVNIPTLLALLAAIASSVVFSMGAYNNLSDRIVHNTSDIALIRQDVSANKASSEQARRDVKGQLHDINTKLDALLWDRGDRAKVANNPALRKWTKK